MGIEKGGSLPDAVLVSDDATAVVVKEVEMGVAVGAMVGALVGIAWHRPVLETQLPEMHS